MRIVSAAGLCAVIVAGGIALSFIGAQDKPSQAVPISAIELNGSGTFMPWHTRMVVQSDGRAEWSSTLEPRVGEFVGKVATADWERLVKFLELVQFDQFKPSYGSPCDDCPEQSVVVHRGAESQTITSYSGEGPVKLWAVRMVMHGIADTITWAPAPEKAGK